MTILNLIAASASIAMLILSLGSIAHMLAAHWRQIRMALGAELIVQPDPIPPVRYVRPGSIPPLRGQPDPALQQRLPIAA